MTARMGMTVRHALPMYSAWGMPRPGAAEKEFCERYWPCLEPDDLELRALLHMAEYAVDYGSKRCDTCVYLTEDGRCGWRSIPSRQGWPLRRLPTRGRS